jgi:acyl-CoA synthetase (NDP forming)
MLLAYFVSPGIFIERILGEMGIEEDLVALETDKLSIDYAEKFFSLTRLHPDKPIVGFTYRSLQEKMIRTLLDRGIPVYQDPERAVRAMAAVWKYYEKRESMKADAA